MGTQSALWLCSFISHKLWCTVLSEPALHFWQLGQSYSSSSVGLDHMGAAFAPHVHQEVLSSLHLSVVWILCPISGCFAVFVLVLSCDGFCDTIGETVPAIAQFTFDSFGALSLLLTKWIVDFVQGHKMMKYFLCIVWNHRLENKRKPSNQHWSYICVIHKINFFPHTCYRTVLSSVVWRSVTLVFLRCGFVSPCNWTPARSHVAAFDSGPPLSQHRQTERSRGWCCRVTRHSVSIR